MQALKSALRRWLPDPIRIPLARVYRRLTLQQVILCYHRIAEVEHDPWDNCVSPRNFAEQLDVLKDWGVILPFDRLVAGLGSGDLPKHAAALTFDDGYADNLHVAKPILAQRDMPALVFLVTGMIGRAEGFWWDRLEQLLLWPDDLPASIKLTIGADVWARGLEDLGPSIRQRLPDPHVGTAPGISRQALFVDLWTRLRRLHATEREAALAELETWAGGARVDPDRPRPLTAGEVAELVDGGLVQIGAHSVNHALLPAMPADVQRDEIEGSRAACAALVGRPPLAFAYPYGEATPETVDLVRAAGYRWACETFGPPLSANLDPLQLPRIPIENWDGETFERKLAEGFAA